MYDLAYKGYIYIITYITCFCTLESRARECTFRPSLSPQSQASLGFCLESLERLRIAATRSTSPVHQRLYEEARARKEASPEPLGGRLSREDAKARSSMAAGALEALRAREASLRHARGDLRGPQMA